MSRMGDELFVETRTSGIWQLSSAVLSSRGHVVVVDPGYFPRELSELRALAAARGEVVGVVFTHGHWDHVLGWREFPRARIFGSPSLVEAVRTSAPAARKNLEDARDFDGRWYVDRGAPIAWPPVIEPLGESPGPTLTVGDLALEPLTLPGHSADGLGLVLRARGLLVAGDYLSPCEIPFVEDLAAYRDTLRRLLALLPDLDEVIPGHGPRLSAREARAIAEADLTYLDRLTDRAAAGDVAGALALELPRAASVPGMAEHHLDNVRAAGLPVP